MATKKIELDVIAKDKASAVLSKVSKSVDDVGKKSKSMSNDMAKGITQVAAPFLAVQKIIGGLGSSLEEFEKRTGKTDGLTSLKKSVGDISAQIGAGLYPAFQMLSKIVNDNKDRFLKLGAQVGTIFSGLIEIVVGFGKVFGGTILTIVGAAMERFHQLRAIILDVFGKKEAAERARAAARAISDEFYDANKAVLDGFQQMGKGVGTVWDGISGKVKINTEKVKEVVKKVTQDIIGDLIEQELDYESQISKLYTELVALEKQKADNISKINNGLYIEELQAKINTEEKKLDIHKQFADKLYQVTRSNNDKTYSGKIANVENEAQAELDIYNMYAKEGIITKQEYADYEAEIEQSKQDKISEIRLNAASSYLDMAANVVSQISTINSMVSEQQLSDLDEQTERRKAAATATIKNRKVLEKELEKIDKEAEKRRKEIAKNEKKIALIGSIINTAQAVTGALAATPGPVGIAMAVIVGVLGAIQTGIIASQAFANGGVVQSEAGKSNTGDNILVRANPGERILTGQQSRAYENVIMGGFSAGPVSIVINGNADANMVQSALAQSREQQMYDMRQLMLEMRSNNMLPQAA